MSCKPRSDSVAQGYFCSINLYSCAQTLVMCS
ncbi:hypothetical protein T11_10952 [Trichinella zimbabwensis]|uniref:Uncharacterized protein n=1 Tax=Trichinella zimbabwensis TaxID=268475 RepID=A0A0V1G6S9_9BILA|nr:hypothetical protein T11_10952 [Trichinella zimbabwensis]